MIKNIYIPQYLCRGIVHNDISFPKRYTLFGADTETVKGNPYTFQVSNDGEKADVVFVNKHNVLDKFLSYIEPKMLKGHVNIMYFHNLGFDLWVLLKNYQYLAVGRSKLELVHKGVEFNIIFGKVHFGRIRFPNNKVLTIVDSYAFFTGFPKSSLSYLAKELDLKYQKIGKLKDIGRRYYKKGSLKYSRFVEYARQDAIVEWHLGAWILEQFKKYNTRICVSSPQFSMRVFRHYYMKQGDCIKFPPYEATRASILSYHGGKNGYYVGDGVTVVKKCVEVDIVSAYPHAMRNLPNFLSGDYVFMKRYTDRYEGVWCVSGDVAACKYPSLFSHDFKPLSGKVNGVWVTSYELREALGKGEIALSKCSGYVWVPDGKSDHNPFKEFVNYFFKQKDKAKNKPERILAKLILNSLYGKMIQTVEDDKTEDKKDGFRANYFYDKENAMFIETKGQNIFFAGGMFNPFLASLITGSVRAYLHRLEHKYSALHSSTDSVKTLEMPKEDKRLGGIKTECVGKCYLFRNKLYLHYDRKGGLRKYALHGFLGRPEQLLEMFKEKRNTYTVKHLYKVKEALRQNKTPLAMETVKRELKDVDFTKVTYI